MSIRSGASQRLPAGRALAKVKLVNKLPFFEQPSNHTRQVIRQAPTR